MKKIVLKFGGTSVADSTGRQRAASIIREARETWDGVVVVVSAMGRRGAPYATDTLLQLFSHQQALPQNREQDLIYACGEIISASVLSQELNSSGIPNIVLTGGQAGIETNDRYSDADILTIHTGSVNQQLEKGSVVIVTGGQGMTADGDFTALGRGGSDTTACAIGYYLDADQVRIYTDVDGIYTGDPRIIRNARKIPYISYVQCRRLAEYGAKVIHPRAVSYSEKGTRNVLSVRSTFTDGPGTSIGAYDNRWSGITALRDLLTVQIPRDREPAFRQVLAGYGETPRFYAADGEEAFFGIQKSLAGKDGIPDGQPGDVIFAVGPDAKPETASQALGDSHDCRILKLSSDSLAVTVPPELYEQQINRLHDRICLN